MKHDRITCPHCGGAIEISEVLVAELRADLEQRFDKEKQAALSAGLERARKQQQQALREQEQRNALEVADLKEQVAERGRRVEQAQRAEIELRKKARELEARQQELEVAFARNASKGKSEKMEMIYHYLSGNEFRQRVEAIVESFDAMHTQLTRERRAMGRLWKEREKQIQRITTNTIGMYGEMRGIIGATLPEIQALELDMEPEPDQVAERLPRLGK